jgi:N-acetylmuramoyl-L-alanine amidase
MHLKCLLFLLIWLPVMAMADELPAVKAVRLGEQPNGTRFVLEISQDIPFSVSTRSKPNQVLIDFPKLDWRVLAGSQGRGVISNFRYGAYADNSFRVILDVKAPVKVLSASMVPPSEGKPYRFILDIAPVLAGEFKAQKVGKLDVPKLKAAAAPEPAPQPEVKTQHIIVIDAGHGGVDPGAIGKRGSYEKNVTLAIAQELAKQLRESGKYKVILTRDKDVFIPLRDRVKRARAAGADLFVSLHADSNPTRDVRGASIYTLSDQASDTEAARLAENENKVDLIAGVDLADKSEKISSMLIDLAQRETRNLSHYYGTLLVSSLDRVGEMVDSPLRAAGFAVLTAPDVPSVLIEMGYISNPKDEDLLNDPAYRTRLAGAIADAVGEYFAKVNQLPRS